MFCLTDVDGKQDVKENQVMVFMKGVPQAPQCGFSAMVVRILDEYGTVFLICTSNNLKA